MTTVSVRISSDLVEAARREAMMFTRTLSGQLEHWAKLGQAIESVPSFTTERMRAALQGRLDADRLDAAEREIYEDLAGEALASPLPAELEFFDALRREGGAVGFDGEGRLVRGLPEGGAEAIK
ncbi:MAG: ParD-like family protein [Azoarcus sp.]|nr:ParD-like family protein [Azoarcus sp.]